MAGTSLSDGAGNAAVGNGSVVQSDNTAGDRYNVERYESVDSCSDTTDLVCILVGLPARGKTFIAQKVCRYLQWMGIRTQVFNVGTYRRKIAGAQQPHQFFDAHNDEANILRKQAADQCLSDMLQWFRDTADASAAAIDSCMEHSATRVAIYDATNSTLERRQWLKARCEGAGKQVMFIESVCDDMDLILENIREVKLSSPDYLNTSPEKAAADFMARIQHYEEIYETVGEQADETMATFVKLINIGSQVIINRINGYLQSRIVYYLMNLHIAPRSILMCRHGESMYNLVGKIGGDSDLSPRGREFARQLPEVVKRLVRGADHDKLTVWTSTLKRTLQTSEHLKHPKLQWKALDEIDAGVCDGLTYEEVEKQFPEDFAERDKDKYHYRYRAGESYKDLVLRLEPIIMELERQRNILIIGHQAVLRAIYAYFLNLPQDRLPYVHIPLHAVIQITPKAYGSEERMEKVAIDAVDTHRSRPSHGQRHSYGDKNIVNLLDSLKLSPAVDTAPSPLSPLPQEPS